MTTSPSRVRRAFTLIELLMVITIMLILAGLAIAGVGMAMTNAKRTQTGALLGEIEGVINKYYDMTGRYPLEDAGEGDDPVANNALMVTELRGAIRDDIFSADKLHGGRLVDAWGSPLRYQHFLHYPDSGPRAGKRSDSYQLWSMGPDTVDQQGGGDDICNWK